MNANESKRPPIEELDHELDAIRGMLSAFRTTHPGAPLDARRLIHFTQKLDQKVRNGQKQVVALRKQINDLERGVRWRNKSTKKKKATKKTNKPARKQATKKKTQDDRSVPWSTSPIPTKDSRSEPVRSC